MRTIAEFFPGRPALLNAERSKHWREHREQTKATREEARYQWHRYAHDGPMDHVKIDVYPTYAKGQLPDTGACIPAVKAIIDGATDVGIIDDDGPDTVTHLAFHRPVHDLDRGDGLMIVFTELEEDSPWLT